MDKDVMGDNEDEKIRRRKEKEDHKIKLELEKIE